jgi:hypothetical protein
MRKEQTAARKARSTRNRHNGKINLWKNHVIQHGKTYTDNTGQIFHALPNSEWIQDPTAIDGDGELDRTKGKWKITSSIIKVKGEVQ